MSARERQVMSVRWTREAQRERLKDAQWTAEQSLIGRIVGQGEATEVILPATEAGVKHGLPLIDRSQLQAVEGHLLVTAF